ncbi:hypothetical protein IU479_08130 [Nocardia abscessus]|uniref:DUF7683 domain-containing protein n=1 Tax=Nocardia TaxID=1817 RepID=UPI001893C68F|nr:MULTISPECIES: hypothetical protein [Nocardia]MBF6218077.1 hypothetical protein [Nocardia abscessus]MDE1670554.1 hypothetical protein [Nocardia gipuzkoensis]
MNYLEAYDRKSGFLVDEYPLRGIDLAELKRLLNIDEGIEIYGCDVSRAQVGELARYISKPFAIDDACDYQVGFYRE